MPKINVTTAFDILMPTGGSVSVKAGESDVPNDVAEHPFVKAHMVSTPKGRLPLVKGEGGMMIEADEAGQRVGPRQFMLDPMQPPLRQEGPFSAQQVPEDAPDSATEGTPVPEEVREKMAPMTLPAMSPAAAKQPEPPKLPTTK